MLASTSDEISKSQLNTSKSKAQYSFPKASRFPNHAPHDNPNICYNTLSGFDHRAAGFGYGTKSDFTKATLDTPDPTKYASQESLSVTRPSSKAYTFGVSRDKCAKRYIEGHFLADPAVPGPGTYKIEQKIGNEGLKYSFRAKTMKLGKDYLDSIFNCQQVPGPGAYRTSVGGAIGASVLSTIKSSPNVLFSHKSFERFQVSKDEGVPGPGAYKTGGEMLNGYPLSQYKYEGARKFTNSQREFFGKRDLDTPGPGSYRLPSEFGYYESKKKKISMPSLKMKKDKL